MPAISISFDSDKDLTPVIVTDGHLSFGAEIHFSQTGGLTIVDTKGRCLVKTTPEQATAQEKALSEHIQRYLQRDEDD